MDNQTEVTVEFYFDGGMYTEIKKLNIVEFRAMEIAGVICRENRNYSLGCMVYDINDNILKVDVHEK